MTRPLVSFCAVLLVTSVTGFGQTTQVARELDEIARIASVMVDGDLCQNIVTPRAAQYMAKKDPRDPWADADNYDVNDTAFIAVKKTLIRLSRLVDFPTDVNLWMPVPNNPARIHIVIRNRNELSQFWEWGKLSQDMFPEMQAVLSTGKRATVRQKPGLVSVLAPVHNSLSDIVGLVEVVTRTIPDVRENVK